LIVFGLAVPVQGLAPMSGYFFTESEKYKSWFQEFGPYTVPSVGMVGDRVTIRHNAPLPAAIAYPYPEKEFEMTEEIWRNAVNRIEFGMGNWFDAEVIRQRAVLEELPKAMDLLGWMYEHGSALSQDYRKAFVWYLRAELAGATNLRGSYIRLYHSKLNALEKRLAMVDVKDEAKRAENRKFALTAGLISTKIHATR
jgi:TPR repeat protein